LVTFKDKSGSALVWVLFSVHRGHFAVAGRRAKPPDRGTMSHDKIKAAARERMSETGESYAAARRKVAEEFRAAGSGAQSGKLERFAIRYEDVDRFSQWVDNLKAAHIEIDAHWLRVRFGGFNLDVPRASVNAVSRSAHQARGTIGVHSRRGNWLVNGSADGLVEIMIDPPCRTERQPSTLFLRMKVNQLIVSLVDPDGFITVASHWLPKG
jgi:hypothetical protein